MKICMHYLYKIKNNIKISFHQKCGQSKTRTSHTNSTTSRSVVSFHENPMKPPFQGELAGNGVCFSLRHIIIFVGEDGFCRCDFVCFLSWSQAETFVVRCIGGTGGRQKWKKNTEIKLNKDSTDKAVVLVRVGSVSSKVPAS